MPRPELNAGDLDRRVRLLRPLYNEYEDEITGWEEVTQVWASVEPETKSEIREGERSVMVAAVPIVIRYRTDIDARWRVQDRDHVYEILSLADISRRRVQLELTCQEVV